MASWRPCVSSAPPAQRYTDRQIRQCRDRGPIPVAMCLHGSCHVNGDDRRPIERKSGNQNHETTKRLGDPHDDGEGGRVPPRLEPCGHGFRGVDLGKSETKKRETQDQGEYPRQSTDDRPRPPASGTAPPSPPDRLRPGQICLKCRLWRSNWQSTSWRLIDGGRSYARLFRQQISWARLRRRQRGGPSQRGRFREMPAEDRRAVRVALVGTLFRAPWDCLALACVYLSGE